MVKLGDYTKGQSARLVNYGLRYRQGKSIGTASIEGLANTLVNRRMNKLQQIRWSAVGAHAVVVVRAHHINAANFSSPTLASAAKPSRLEQSRLLLAGTVREPLPRVKISAALSLDSRKPGQAYLPTAL